MFWKLLQREKKLGNPGTRELVNFKEFIGYHVHPKTGEKTSTTWGIIHYSKGGTHIVPGAPLGYEKKIKDNEAYLLQLTQRALLGEIVSELRAVFVKLEKNQILSICFFYDCKVSEKIYDISSCIISEIVAGFPPCYFQAIEEKIVKLKYPRNVPILGNIAYLRDE